MCNKIINKSLHQEENRKKRTTRKGNFLYSISLWTTGILRKDGSRTVHLLRDHGLYFKEKVHGSCTDREVRQKLCSSPFALYWTA